MRYELQVTGNGHTLIVHVEDRVTDIAIYFDGPGVAPEDQLDLVRDLFEIRGICSMTIMPHKIELAKGHVFEWNELVAKILNVVKNHLCPEEELKEWHPPTELCRDSCGDFYAKETNVISVKH
jgi:hypothetical protein